ncbi:RnfABCDGE type electron transport complex subunit G [Petroclostridium sp. X23]|uniref:RnfABCDGE type electron transport complex subunit G n=1 Tax=Petroclostridium sp. X23 TaxID=3045146 RepID=UPI0024AE84AB|nr:RnfABCDGE type electron transport complex subunit G [Petroclostridium sp. X23]WHH61042.1 RnfABCDGE type electron transport complex subunit G [Petroclostridium sp. X23]
MRNNEIMRLGAILCAITFVVALILALGNLATEDKIAALTLQAQIEARKEVLPAASEFEELKVEGLGEGDYKTVKSVFAGKSGGNIVGYSVGVAPNGFGGAIDMIVGIDNAGKITGITIVNFSETPGLGTKAKEPKFKDQYNGKPTKDYLAVIKNGTPKDNEVVAISGATITSNAVTEGVNSAIKAIKEKVNK